MGSPVRFKFKRFNEKGKNATLLSERGCVDDKYLTLGEREVPLSSVALARRSPGTLVVHLVGQNEPIAVAFTSGDARKVLNSINIRASAARADRHLRGLADRGESDLFRSVQCPHCTATNELTGHPQTAQVYCLYCDTVFTPDYSPARQERGYHKCPTCGLYGQVRSYTSFNFVFAVVFYYLRTKPHRECRTCMRTRVWDTLLTNLPFVLGTPPAIYQIIRAYRPMGGPLAGLDGANRWANSRTKRRAHRMGLEKATRTYEQMQQELTHCAPVRYNHAVALQAAGRTAQAAQKLEQALADCANFEPAYAALCQCYATLGELARIEELHATWNQAQGYAAD